MALERQVEQAVDSTMAGAEGLAPFLTRCNVSKLVYDFLMVVKEAEGCPWYVKIAIRQLHGAISQLRRKWGCA